MEIAREEGGGAMPLCHYMLNTCQNTRWEDAEKAKKAKQGLKGSEYTA